jgi:tRNA(Ile)-lysidine synthase
VAFTAARLASALDDCLVGVARPASGLCVALSGGLDSTVLLAGLVRARADSAWPPLRAAHVDHGLHADSATWADRSALQAMGLGVPLVRLSVDARPAAGESPEAAARKARYAALAGCLEPGEVLLTAHHADDQLETVLLQWLRGGGLRSVAGMPAVAAFAAGWHARPLLGFSRAELHAWARESGLAWLEDPSNLDRRFDRNYLRLEVLPVLRRRWPAAARTVGRVALQAAEALEVEAAVAGSDLSAVEDGGAISLERLHDLPEPRQRRVLRAWLRRAGLPLPSARTLAALLHDVTRSADDRVPCVNWRGARVYRYRGRLFGTSGCDEATGVPSGGTWHQGTAFDLGSLGRLELRAATGIGLSRARLPPELQVAWRATGELFRPAGAGHRRPLRKWLQQRGVLPWLRGQIPLVIAHGEIVAIGDLAYGHGFHAQPGEPSWVIEWQGRPVLTEQEAVESRPTP